MVLERESLHILDGNRRVALVETKTIDTSTTRTPLPTTVTRYQLDNHLQSASLELDDTAQVISYEEYYPYGDTSYRSAKSGVEVSEKRYRYTGKEKDEESGLYYHGARYYASWLGRWTAADPAGMVDGACLYAYVRNHPTGLVDPDGRAAEASIPPMSAKVLASWGAAEKAGYDANSVDSLLRATEAQRDSIHQARLTRQTVLEYATIRASAAESNWRHGNYFAAIGNGAVAVVESFGYGIFGDSPKETARNAAVALVAGYAIGKLANFANRPLPVKSSPFKSSVSAEASQEVPTGNTKQLPLPAESVNSKVLPQNASENPAFPTRVQTGSQTKSSSPLATTTSDDGMATWSKVPTDPKAFARVEVEGSKIQVTDIFRGDQAPGSGAKILAPALEKVGIKPGDQLVFKGIINPETIESYQAGADPASSVLGKLGSKTLEQIGLKAMSFEFQVYRGKLNLIIGVGK